MTFWIAAGLLTLAASLAVLLPLTARAEGGADVAGRELAVYRDQLAEVERDAARGLIAGEAAVEARAEIGRRILRLGAGGPQTQAARRPRLYRFGAAAAVLFVPVLSWGVYGVLGSPDLPPQPLRARLDTAPEDSTVAELLGRAEAHLAANPQDGKGWSVIAPIYLRLSRFGDAATAYRNALRFAGATADREAGLGEALAGAAHGAVTPDARAAFGRALTLEPGHALARFQLAAAAAQDGRTADAVAAWNGLLAGLPEDSPWRGVVAQAIAAAGDAGPTGEQVASARQMPGADRAAMIEGMVAGLDRKLRLEPQDPDGWMRLVRSYLVLEKAEAARDALSRGRAALGAASEDGRKLVAFAASLGLSEDAQP